MCKERRKIGGKRSYTYIYYVQTQGEHAREKVERDIKKYSAALEIHVI